MFSYQDYLEERHYNMLRDSISISRRLAGYDTLRARPISVWGRDPRQYQFEGEAHISLGMRPTSVSVRGRDPHRQQFWDASRVEVPLLSVAVLGCVPGSRAHCIIMCSFGMRPRVEDPLHHQFEGETPLSAVLGCVSPTIRIRKASSPLPIKIIHHHHSQS